ncbi:MAG: hypothetical protein LC687_00120, partial [Actinobacteria bacterium]|nr:hypothetical protein [Actinomycetota bacterium]
GHYRELTRTLTDKSNALQDTLDILRRDEPILYRPPSQEKLTEKRMRVEKLSEDITQSEKEIEGIARLRESLKMTEARIREKKMLLNSYKKEYDLLQARMTSATQNLDQLKEGIAKTELTLGNLRAKETLKSELMDIREEVAKLTRGSHDIELQLELADKGVCPTCRRDVPEEWKENKEDKQQERQTIERKISQLDDKTQELNDQWQKRMALEASLSKSNSSLEAYTKGLEDAKAQLDDYHEKSYQGAAQTELEVLESDKVDLESKIEAFKRDHSDAISRLESMKKDLGIAKTSLRELEDLKRDYESKVEILKDNNKRKEEVDESLFNLRNEEVGAQKKLEVFEVAEKLVDKYLPTFGVLTAGEEVTRGMLGIINPVLPSWDIRLAPSREGVFFEYRENEEDEFSPISMASGFETALCNVAFKLTLTAYYGLPLMILDEIDEAAEDENSYKVFDSISQFRRAYQIHQVWLVSHKKEVVTQLLQEYGQDTQVFHVNDGIFTHTWQGGAMK